MSSYYKTIPAVIASGSQASTAVKIEGQNGIAIELPTFTIGLNTAAAAVNITGCETATGTFRPIHTYSAASGYNAWGIPSGAGHVIVSLGPNAICLPKFIKINITGTNATATAAAYTAVVHMYA